MDYGDSSILSNFIFQIALGLIFFLSFAFSVYGIILMVKEKENIERHKRAKLFMIIGLVITALVLLVFFITKN